MSVAALKDVSEDLGAESIQIGIEEQIADSLDLTSSDKFDG